MPFHQTTVLATSWLNEPELGQRPARTLFVGAAVLHVRRTFADWSLDLRTHSTTVTDDTANTFIWLADEIRAPARMLLWRAEDIVVPSLVAAAETARDAMAGARLLRALDGALAHEVVDVAHLYGGARARSFDAVAHAHTLPYLPQSREQLAEAHRTGCHGNIRDHLATRAGTIWRLWLREQAGEEQLKAATEAWAAEQAERTRGPSRAPALTSAEARA